MIFISHNKYSLLVSLLLFLNLLPRTEGLHCRLQIWGTYHVLLLSWEKASRRDLQWLWIFFRIGVLPTVLQAEWVRPSFSWKKNTWRTALVPPGAAWKEQKIIQHLKSIGRLVWRLKSSLGFLVFGCLFCFVFNVKLWAENTRKMHASYFSKLKTNSI